MAQGFSQVPGHDYKETHSPVVKTSIVHLFLSLAITHNWQHRQVDINNAFLKGDLSEDVYMLQPLGFEKHASDGSMLVCKLQKTLYTIDFEIS